MTSTLPAPGRLAATIEAAHASGRAVAIHCVTAEQLVVAASAVEQAGPPGRTSAGPDRIEHAGIVPPATRTSSPAWAWPS